MLRRLALTLLIAAAPALALAQSRGSPRYDAITIDGAATAGSVVTPSLLLGGFTLSGVGTTAGTLAAGNDTRITGATQNAAAAITGGTINGTTIGDTTPAAATFTTATAASLVGPLAGNASTATALATPRTFSLSGDVSGSASFNGTASPTIPATLVATGVSAGSYGSSSTIPILTIDGKGRVTAASAAAVATTGGTTVPPQGRLTLASGTPVLTSAVSAATSVLYTPAIGNLVPLWTGSAFAMTACAETAQALSDATKSPSAAAASQVYDYFAWSDAGTCRVTRGPAWSAGASAGSNTARGTGAGSTALTRVNGLLTNSAAITNGPAAGYGVYVGTIMTDAGGATVTFNPGSSAAGGGAAWIGLWNAFNRTRIVASVRDSTASWTYGSATWRPSDNSTANRATFVLGLADEAVSATYAVRVSTAGANGVAVTSIGLDSTGTPSPLATMALVQSGGSFIQAAPVATFAGSPGIGVHFLQALEAGDGSTTSTFSGNGYQSLVVDGRF